MSTTFGALKTRVALVLQDPDGKTFTTSMVAELIQQALVEVGRLVPEQFVEDLTPVDNQMQYTLRSDVFSSAVPEIEPVRVEVWDASTSPDTFIQTIPPAATEFARGADSGWVVWGGQLKLPTRFITALVGHDTDYVIRVFGYSPYAPPVDDADVISISAEAEAALVEYCHLLSLRMLLASRNLFTQWQTRSGNTDMSPAALMNEKNIAQSEWRIRSRSIQRLRSEV